jgi:cytochrome o ubiquinol oxidase subunit 2
MEELIWWAIPLEIILVLGALTWSSTHELDPYRPLTASTTPMVIEVVALDWKWLFIYPSLGIATVNEVDFPIGTPLEFHITADAPMNSFWIPQLGGQIYAMTGMVTQVHLIADQPGSFNGYSANYSGDGFADMKFVANAKPTSDFNAWVAAVKQTPHPLLLDTYNTLAKPGTTTVTTYAPIEKNLYNSIVMKFMSAPQGTGTADMAGMHH